MPKPSVDPVRVQPPVFATGIPLPELLIPEGDFKPPQGTPTTRKPQKQPPEVVVIKKLQNSFVVPPSSNSGKRPQGDNDMDIFNLLPGKGDKEAEEEEVKPSTVTVAILPASTTRVILPILQTTTPAPPPTMTTPTTPARQDL